MRPLLSLFLTTLLVAGSAHAQGVIHLVGPGSQSNSPAAPELVEGRIAAAAREYRQYAPVPRVAFFDIAYPADTAEYRRMGGHAVILVTALSQIRDELPVTPYLRTKTGDVTLRLVTWVVGGGNPSDSIVPTVFGTNRIDALYLIPVHQAALGADLLVDYARNRTGFKLGSIAASLPPALQPTPRVAAGAQPAPDAILRLIQREYPGFVASAPGR